jgi:ATP-dependent helicase/nuclease subunit B
VVDIAKDAAVVPALAAAARQGLTELISAFLLGDRAFLARPHPKREPAGKDYDHLARLAEWHNADADAE